MAATEYDDAEWLEGRDGDGTDAHEWSSDLPSGLRPPVNEAAAQVKAARDKHRQRVDRQSAAFQKFVPTQFIAHVDDIRFGRNGDLIIKLVVPYEFKALALTLSDAVAIPLSFDVQVWNPYAEAAI